MHSPLPQGESRQTWTLLQQIPRKRDEFACQGRYLICKKERSFRHQGKNYFILSLKIGGDSNLIKRMPPGNFLLAPKTSLEFMLITCQLKILSDNSRSQISRWLFKVLIKVFRMYKRLECR